MPLNENDWILLNAYLDGELAPEEQAAVEARLARDPALQDELVSLRQTVEMIGTLERRSIPRGVTFTLDPAIYGRAKPRPAVSLWGWGTALSAVGALAATAMMCAGALLAVGSMGIGGGIAAAPAEEEEAYYEAAEEPPLAEMVVEMEEVEAVEEAAPEEEAVEEVAPVAEAAAADEEDVAEAAEVPVEGEAEAAVAEPPGTTTPALVPTVPMEAGAAQVEPPPEGEEPLGMPSGSGMGGGGENGPPTDATRDMLTPTTEAMVPPAEELAELAPTGMPAVEPTASPMPPPPSGTLFDTLPMPGVFIGFGLIGLGGLLLAVVILAWFARRRRR